MANMAQHKQQTNYTQGYSNSTVATHQLRTVETDAAFLIPHIKKTDKILDVGCGPGTITRGLAKCACEGTTIGIDISKDVLDKAKALAAEDSTPESGAVIFDEGNVLEGLTYPDNSFDIVFCSQLFPHLPPPDLPARALTEMRRVLKPGGILATRDAADLHFYPQGLDVNRLWVRNLYRVLRKGAPELEMPGADMPALFRSVGFDVDGGKVRVGAGTTVFSGPEARRWFANRNIGQLQEGDSFRQRWLDAGISEEEIQQTLQAIEEWATTEDAWYAALQCEMLAWK